MKLTVNTTTAKTWLEALFSGSITLTVGTELNLPYTGSSNPRFGLINLTSTTLQWADVDKTATPSIDGALKFYSCKLIKNFVTTPEAFSSGTATGVEPTCERSSLQNFGIHHSQTIFTKRLGTMITL